MKNARFIIAIISNLLDEAIIVAFIVFGLPRLGVHIPVWGIVLICLGFLVYAVLFYRIGSTILRKKPLPGFSDMTGIEGKAMVNLAPKGIIKIESELWEAKTENGTIEAGSRVVVVRQEGMKLIVAPISEAESQRAKVKPED
jgi:membrane protein implicated in regulation of membrane protease activity